MDDVMVSLLTNSLLPRNVLQIGVLQVTEYEIAK